MRDRKVLVRNSWGNSEGKKRHNSWRSCAESERKLTNFSFAIKWYVTEWTELHCAVSQHNNAQVLHSIYIFIILFSTWPISPIRWVWYLFEIHPSRFSLSWIRKEYLSHQTLHIYVLQPAQWKKPYHRDNSP